MLALNFLMTAHNVISRMCTQGVCSLFLQIILSVNLLLFVVCLLKPHTKPKLDRNPKSQMKFLWKLSELKLRPLMHQVKKNQEN